MDEYMRVYNYVYDTLVEDVLSYDNLKSEVAALVSDEWDASWEAPLDGSTLYIKHDIEKYALKLAEAITDAMMFFADDDLMY